MNRTIYVYTTIVKRFIVRFPSDPVGDAAIPA
jgi:hypothetical protein